MLRFYKIIENGRGKCRKKREKTKVRCETRL